MDLVEKYICEANILQTIHSNGKKKKVKVTGNSSASKIVKKITG